MRKLIFIALLISGSSSYSQECDPFMDKVRNSDLLYYGVPTRPTRGELNAEPEDPVLARLPAPLNGHEIRILNRDCGMVGALYRFSGHQSRKQDFDVYVTALHVVEGLRTAQLASAFLNAGLLLKDYSAYEVIADGRKLDLIFFIRNGVVSQRPGGTPASELLERKNLWDSVQVRAGTGDAWASLQLNRSEQGSFENFSRGWLQLPASGLIRLAPGRNNHTSPGNSGSLLYTLPQADALDPWSVHPSSWMIGGIITCLDRKRSEVQAIPVSEMVGSRLVPVTIADLASRRPGTVVDSVDCDPIDRRLGGD